MEAQKVKSVSTARAGRLLHIDAGEYSDHETVGFFVVLRDFDPEAELRTFLGAHPEQQQCHFSKYDYLGALVQRGLLLEIGYDRYYLGAYGDVSLVYFESGSPT